MIFLRILYKINLSDRRYSTLFNISTARVFQTKM